MSIKLMTQIWDKADVSGSELLVLLALADHAKDDAICWPSLPRIAQRARLSVRQTQRVIQKLVDAGHLAILSKGDGRGHSTHYQVLIKDDKMTTLKDDNMSTFDEERVTSGAIKDDIAMSTEPYNRKEEGEKVSPSFTQHRTLPGVAKPRWRQEKRNADQIAKQRDKMGLTARELTALTNKVLERMNALELADSDTDYGDEEFTQAQQATLAIAAIGHKTLEAVDRVFDTWKTVDWRGKKGEAPNYKTIVEHAKNAGMQISSKHPATPQAIKVQRVEGEDW